DEIVSSSDEVDHKPKKLKLKGGLKRKRNASDSDSDSSSFDEEKIRRLVNKMNKKSDTKVLTMMMEILLEPTSNKLCGRRLSGTLWKVEEGLGSPWNVLESVGRLGRS
nr:hypothetical protein [Tanacetum cinerariifolium]